MKQITHPKLKLLALSVMAGLSSIATAQEDEGQNKLEVIEVSAQKVVQNIQDVPISVTAMNGEMIEEAGIRDLSEMSAYVPNLTIADSAINTNIFIRGVGSGNNRAFEQSVGMFIDGVYMGRDRQYRVPFLDLGRAEVLRGPQGILFGKNTIAGTLNLSTQRASAGADLTGSLALEWEPDYNGRKITGILDTGLSEDLGMRIAFMDGSSDGYMYNQHLDRDEPAVDDQVLRVSFNWQPTSDLEINLKLEKSSFSVAGSTSQIIHMDPLTPVAGFVGGMVIPALDPNFETTRDLKRSSDNVMADDARDTDTENLALTVDYSVDGGTWTFVTGYSAYDSLESFDADFTPHPFITTSEDHDFSQLSQEIRFVSDRTDSFEYITGLYYQRNDFKVDIWSNANVQYIAPVLNQALTTIPAALLNPAAPPGVTLWDIGIRPESISRSAKFDQEGDTLSAFFQGTWHMSDDARVVFGGRYSKEDKSATRATVMSEFGSTYYDSATPTSVNGLVTAQLLNLTIPLDRYDGERTENNFTPSVKFQYDLNSDVMLYANAERGYKSGGINAAPDATLATQEFEEEKATGFELGMKSDLLDGQARLNLALFHTEFEDLQVTTWNGFAFEVGNAAESVTRGLEMDGQILLGDNWQLSASLSYLDSYYKQYTAGPCTVAVQVATGQSQCDLSGQDTPYSPGRSGSVFLDYFNEIGDMEFNASVNLNYTGDYYLDTDLDETLKQVAYTSVNVRLGLTSGDGDWEVAIVGKNLTDKRTIVAGLDTPLVAGGFAAYTGAPRTWTLQAKVHF